MNVFFLLQLKNMLSLKEKLQEHNINSKKNFISGTIYLDIMCIYIVTYICLFPSGEFKYI